jgi:hypothetical protein
VNIALVLAAALALVSIGFSVSALRIGREAEKEMEKAMADHEEYLKIIADAESKLKKLESEA